MSRGTRNGKVIQYDVLRVITTLLVVISHGHYHVLDTPYGGIDHSALVDPGSFSWILLGDITEFINTFTMPVFMALGGALFFRSMEKGRFQSLGALAANKAKRLLLPFLVVATLYSFPLKFLTGYYDDSQNVLWDFFVGQLLVQGNTHLWYLTAMFFDFLICYVLEVHVKIPRLIKLVALAVVSVYAWRITDPILMLVYPLRFAVWFYAGYCFETVRDRVDRFTGMSWGLIGCVATGLVYAGVRLMFDGIGFSGYLRSIGLKLLVPAVAGLALYALACGLAGTKLMGSKLYDLLSRDSFGIYLYSDPINYVVLYLGATFFGAFLFGDGLGVFVLYALRIMTTLVCSILITELLRRCKVKHII